VVAEQLVTNLLLMFVFHTSCGQISGTAVSNLTSSPNYPNNPTGSGQLTTGRISTQHQYPSNDGWFMIHLPGSTENAVVSIYDFLGRMVYKKNAQGSNRIEINSQLKTGVYMVRIQSNAGSFTKKLIVK